MHRQAVGSNGLKSTQAVINSRPRGVGAQRHRRRRQCSWASASPPGCVGMLNTSTCRARCAFYFTPGVCAADTCPVQIRSGGESSLPVASPPIEFIGSSRPLNGWASRLQADDAGASETSPGFQRGGCTASTIMRLDEETLHLGWEPRLLFPQCGCSSSHCTSSSTSPAPPDARGGGTRDPASVSDVRVGLASSHARAHPACASRCRRTGIVDDRVGQSHLGVIAHCPDDPHPLPNCGRDRAPSRASEVSTADRSSPTAPTAPAPSGRSLPLRALTRPSGDGPDRASDDVIDDGGGPVAGFRWVSGPRDRRRALGGLRVHALPTARPWPSSSARAVQRGADVARTAPHGTVHGPRACCITPTWSG